MEQANSLPDHACYCKSSRNNQKVPTQNASIPFGEQSTHNKFGQLFELVKGVWTRVGGQGGYTKHRPRPILGMGHRLNASATTILLQHCHGHVQFRIGEAVQPISCSFFFGGGGGGGAELTSKCR